MSHFNRDGVCNGVNEKLESACNAHDLIEVLLETSITFMQSKNYERGCRLLTNLTPMTSKA